MSSPTPLPHELGQNLLVDGEIVAEIVAHVRRALRPGDRLVEVGAGDGALTRPLARLGVPLRAYEIDRVRAERLAARLGPHVDVRAEDALRVRWPAPSHVLVSNVPFGVTTALLRRVLPATGWHTAVLLLQWEAARRRAGVGGASMLTAAWWPWFTSTMLRRVPARAFRPVPAVDGGLIRMRRRATPLVTDREAYQRFVRAVFTGRGRGVADVLARTGLLPRRRSATLARELGLGPRTLPRDLDADQWATLFHATRADGGSRGARDREPGRAGPPR